MLRRKLTPVAAAYPGAVDAPSRGERAFGHIRADALIRVAAILALLLLCLTNISNARADSDTCLAKVALFVRELDELLEKEKYHSRPYSDLAERFFPFRDCEAEALLDVVRQPRFIRSIQHSPRTEEYHILFERDGLGAWFSYLVSERKSRAAGAGFTRKP
jgi:hypothetical protein